MPASTQRNSFPLRSLGRGFASADPERQREVLGYVQVGAIETTAPAKPAPSDLKAKAARLDWMRVQPDVEASSYEGGSSRRWR